MAEPEAASLRFVFSEGGLPRARGSFHVPQSVWPVDSVSQKTPPAVRPATAHLCSKLCSADDNLSVDAHPGHPWVEVGEEASISGGSNGNDLGTASLKDETASSPCIPRTSSK